MAPEIMKLQPYYASNTDVWSLGVVLYKMVMKKVPFVGKIFGQMKRRILSVPSFMSLECQLKKKQKQDEGPHIRARPCPSPDTNCSAFSSQEVLPSWHNSIDPASHSASLGVKDAHSPWQSASEDGHSPSSSGLKDHLFPTQPRVKDCHPQPNPPASPSGVPHTLSRSSASSSGGAPEGSTPEKSLQAGQPSGETLGSSSSHSQACSSPCQPASEDERWVVGGSSGFS